MSAIVGLFLKVDKLEELIAESKRNGYSGVHVDLNINDKLDNYGNNAMVSRGQSKSERDAKKPKDYIGTGKVVYVSKEGINTAVKSKVRES